MPRTPNVLTRLRKLCLRLPDTRETLTWGSPHFRVRDKIFCGFGEEDGRPTVGLKLEQAHAALRIETDPRFRRAKYVGRYGWVSIDGTRIKSERELEDLVVESYRLIAPKASLRKLDGSS